MSDEVLLVDDEPNVLQALRRSLHGRFKLQLAEGGPAALKMLQDDGPFAVVVCDMQMPEVSGLTVLAESKRVAPDTIRVMLTGNADQQTAINAVNQGSVFRFLNKPCPADQLAETLESAIRQYQSQTLERTLLTRTLTGTIGLITEFLALVNPTAFGRGGRIRNLTKQFCARLQLEETWQYEIAAMLSQIGCVAVPQQLLDRVARGHVLTASEEELMRSQAEIGSRLISKIPRLEGVAAMIAGQIPGQVQSNSTPTIELGANILRILIDFDLLCEHHSVSEAINWLEVDESGKYNPKLLESFTAMVLGNVESKLVHVAELSERMILDENILTRNGDILITKGHELTTPLIHRLRAFEQGAAGVRQPFRVRVRSNDS
ncbi:MAG: response regulator [Pirellulaceae bacterium]|nr:response regulator [Pirellulaceae bacterium]